MAQLKDSIVSGNLRVTDEVLTDTVQADKIKAPTTSGGTTYGVGSNGQVLTSNGTSTYWGTNGNGTITEVKTTAGAHTAIDVTSGIASFNVPTTAAHVGAAASSHSHGNIANGGTISSTAVDPADQDYLLISDANNSGKIERGVAIGTGTTKFLREDGTWQTPAYPAVYNKTFKIQLSGTDKKSFTANSNTDVTANFVFTAGTTPSTVTKKTVVTSATFNTVVIGGTTTDVPNISKKTVVTSVTPATVVIGGTTTDVPNISKKTVVTSVTKKTVVTDATFNTVVNAASFSNGVLSFGTGVSGSKTTGDSCTVSTGDSVTVGTAIKAYTSLSTGNSCTVSTGDSVTVGTAIKAYTTLNTGVSGSAQTGDSVTVTPGTAPSLSIS